MAVPIRWSAYEHEHPPRESDWFWALGVAAVAIAAASIIFGNILFAILILAAAAALAAVAKAPPELVEFELSDRGVRIGGELHRFDEIISFWVEDEGEAPPLLLVDTVKFLSPNLIIPLQHVDPALVRAFLSERADEVPMKEPLSHKVLEFLGI